MSAFPMIDPVDMFLTASDLLSEEGENVEYDNAIVQLVTSLLGFDTEQQDEVRSRLLEVKNS